MRVLVVAIGSAGDVHPFVGVGQALSLRGHDVHVLTNPYFQNVVERAGLHFHALGTVDDFVRIKDDPNLWHPSKAFETVIHKGVEPTYGIVMDTVAELKTDDCVLVASTLGFGARNARDKFGVPMVTVHLAPVVFMSAIRPPKLPGNPIPTWLPQWIQRIAFGIGTGMTDKLILPELNRFRREHGLEPAKHVVRFWWHSPDRVVGLFPDWYAPPAADWPGNVQLTGFPMFDQSDQMDVPDAFHSFIDEGDPPVVFTPGSAMKHGDRFFAEAAKACELAGWRGIFLTRYADTIPDDLPDGVHHFEYLPLSRVLPHAKALVYHAGIGTLAQALCAGIPHLVHPMAHDQFDNAAWLQRLGVGDALLPKRFTSTRIARRLTRLLKSPSVSIACAMVAKKFDPAAWLDRTCDLIETTTIS